MIQIPSWFHEKTLYKCYLYFLQKKCCLQPIQLWLLLVLAFCVCVFLYTASLRWWLHASLCMKPDTPFLSELPYGVPLLHCLYHKTRFAWFQHKKHGLWQSALPSPISWSCPHLKFVAVVKQLNFLQDYCIKIHCCLLIISLSTSLIVLTDYTLNSWTKWITKKIVFVNWGQLLVMLSWSVRNARDLMYLLYYYLILFNSM